VRPEPLRRRLCRLDLSPTPDRDILGRGYFGERLVEGSTSVKKFRAATAGGFDQIRPGSADCSTTDRRFSGDAWCPTKQLFKVNRVAAAQLPQQLGSKLGL
jgi:hypothetical protein